MYHMLWEQNVLHLLNPEIMINNSGLKQLIQHNKSEKNGSRRQKILWVWDPIREGNQWSDSNQWPPHQQGESAIRSLIRFTATSRHHIIISFFLLGSTNVEVPCMPKYDKEIQWNISPTMQALGRPLKEAGTDGVWRGLYTQKWNQSEPWNILAEGR